MVHPIADPGSLSNMREFVPWLSSTFYFLNISVFSWVILKSNGIVFFFFYDCIVRSPRSLMMAHLLLSVHLLLDPCLLHLHLLQWLTFLHAWPISQLVIVLTFRSEHFHLLAFQEGCALLLVSPVTNEPTPPQFPGPPPRSQDCCHLVHHQLQSGVSLQDLASDM